MRVSECMVWQDSQVGPIPLAATAQRAIRNWERRLTPDADLLRMAHAAGVVPGAAPVVVALRDVG